MTTRDADELKQMLPELNANKLYWLTIFVDLKVLEAERQMVVDMLPKSV